MKLKELLRKFNIQCKLPNNLLKMDIGDGYFEFNIENKLMVVKRKGDVNYEKFKVYIFKNNNKVLEIAPDNPLQTISFYDIIGSRYYGYSINIKGELSTSN